MRGEETQIAGSVGDGSAIVVLPGTHSKWVSVENGRIAGFTTFMTGELFDVLARHSILGRLFADGPGNDEGFQRGLLTARDGAEGLSSALFSVRALGLFADIPADALRDYLSGLLIGHELREALARYPAREVLTIGSPDLVSRYDAALGQFGVASQSADEGAGVKGLVRIARQAGLMTGDAP
jgi:2-dehydro-3-deoxygalactonokinase